MHVFYMYVHTHIPSSCLGQPVNNYADNTIHQNAAWTELLIFFPAIMQLSPSHTTKQHIFVFSFFANSIWNNFTINVMKQDKIEII